MQFTCKSGRLIAGILAFYALAFLPMNPVALRLFGSTYEAMVSTVYQVLYLVIVLFIWGSLSRNRSNWVSTVSGIGGSLVLIGFLYYALVQSNNTLIIALLSLSIPVVIASLVYAAWVARHSNQLITALVGTSRIKVCYFQDKLPRCGYAIPEYADPQSRRTIVALYKHLSQFLQMFVLLHELIEVRLNRAAAKRGPSEPLINVMGVYATVLVSFLISSILYVPLQAIEFGRIIASTSLRPPLCDLVSSGINLVYIGSLLPLAVYTLYFEPRRFLGLFKPIEDIRVTSTEQQMSEPLPAATLVHGFSLFGRPLRKELLLKEEEQAMSALLNASDVAERVKNADVVETVSPAGAYSGKISTGIERSSVFAALRIMAIAGISFVLLGISVISTLPRFCS